MKQQSYNVGFGHNHFELLDCSKFSQLAGRPDGQPNATPKAFPGDSSAHFVITGAKKDVPIAMHYEQLKSLGEGRYQQFLATDGPNRVNVDFFFNPDPKIANDAAALRASIPTLAPGMHSSGLGGRSPRFYTEKFGGYPHFDPNDPGPVLVMLPAADGDIGLQNAFD